jgi:O-antigen/teichoic acid export membrane protein
MITSIVIARVLDPSDYGLWMTLLLIVSYSSIASLGTVETLLKQLPYYMGRGDLNRAREVEGAVLGSLFISVFILIFTGGTFHLFVRVESFSSVLPLVYLMIMTASLSLFSAYYYHRFIAHQNFKIVSALETIRSILSIVLLISCSWLWKLTGTVIGFLICELMLLVLSFNLSRSRFGKVKVSFKLNLLWEMVKIGFPITMVFWFFMLQTSIDRIISISMLGKTATGYYGLGVSIVSMVILIPMTVGRVLYPKINEWVGKSVSLTDMSLIVVKPTLGLSIGIPLVLGTMIFVMPALYYQIFPKYIDGLSSAQILILGSFFACTLRNGVNYLVAQNKQFLLLRHVLVALTFNVICNFTFVKLGLNIRGIAIGTSLSSAILSFLIWKSTLNHMGYGVIDLWTEIIKNYGPFLLLFGIIYSLALIYPASLTKAGLSSIVFVLIFILVYIGIVTFVPPFRQSTKEIFNLVKMSIKSKKETEVASII